MTHQENKTRTIGVMWCRLPKHERLRLNIYSAPWCPSCVKIEPYIHELIGEGVIVHMCFEEKRKEDLPQGFKIPTFSLVDDLTSTVRKEVQTSNKEEILAFITGIKEEDELM